MQPHKPRILLLDLEVAPNVTTVFSMDNRRNQMLSYKNILAERYILTVAWKWYGHPRIYGITVPQRLPHNDRSIVERMSREIAKADLIVGHWATSFDFPWLRGRAFFHRLPPICPVAELDTCKLARRLFYLNSAKLDYLAQYLGIPGKPHTGHELWQRCLLNDKQALRAMLRYNKHDVWILDKVFRAIQPHIPPTLKRKLLAKQIRCSDCGGRLIKRGFLHTRAFDWQRYQCTACGAWSIGEKIERAK